MYVKNEEEFPCPVYNSFSVQNICEVGLVSTKEQCFVHKIQKMHNILCAGSVLVLSLEVEGNSPNLWTFDKTLAEPASEML